jgi:hypothetical protein
MAQRSAALAVPPTLRERGKRFVERVGIHVFFVSLVLFTQIKWITEHRNNLVWRVEERFLLGTLVGVLLAAGVIALVRKLAVRSGKDADALVKELSLALAPGILFFFGARGPVFLYLGAGLCVLVALYVWSGLFRKFVDSVFLNDAFMNTLVIKDGVATIELSGAYDRTDLEVMERFLRDLAGNFHACRELEISRVVVDYSRLAGGSAQELALALESMAGCFALEVVSAADQSASPIR